VTKTANVVCVAPRREARVDKVRALVRVSAELETPDAERPPGFRAFGGLCTTRARGLEDYVDNLHANRDTKILRAFRLLSAGIAGACASGQYVDMSGWSVEA